MIFHCPVSIYVHIIMSTLYKHLFLRKYNHVKVFKRNIDIDYIIHLKLIMYKKKKSTTRPLPRRRRDKPEWNGPPETKPSSRGSEGGPDRRGGRWKPRSAFRVSLPSPRQTSTPPHTRALPTKFTNPPEAQKFPRQGKIPSEIQRSKSVRLLGAPPNPSRIPQIPAEIPQSSVLAAAASSLRPAPPAVAAAAADFHPRVSSRSRSLRSTASTDWRDRPVIEDLLPPERPGLLPRKFTLVQRRRSPLHRRPRALLVLEWRGVEIHPGVDRFLFVSSFGGE
jgi:hypothetical protein